MLQNEIKQFRDIPNIGPVIEEDLIALGLNESAELTGKEPRRLCMANYQSRGD
jgi:Pathogenicity locus